MFENYFSLIGVSRVTWRTVRELLIPNGSDVVAMQLLDGLTRVYGNCIIVDAWLISLRAMLDLTMRTVVDSRHYIDANASLESCENSAACVSIP